MPTSQDSPRRRRAAHFSSEEESSSRRGSRRTGTSASSKRRETKPRRRISSGRSAKVGSRAGTDSTRVSDRTARATKRATQSRRKGASARRRSAHQGNSPLLVLVAGAIVIAVVAFSVIMLPRLFQNAEEAEEVKAGEEVVITVPEGASGNEIATLLVDNHILSSTDEFFREVQRQNAESSLKNGSYTFITGASASEVVRQLQEGPNATQFRLRLAEGLTLKKTAAQVEEQLGVSASEFEKKAVASAYAKDYPFLKEVASEYDSLEGFLYAKTYDLGEKGEVTVDSVIRTLLDQYESEVASLDMAKDEKAIASKYKIKMNDYEIIKLASIIEKEAVTDDDRPLVSSVIYNRMRDNMMIQSDATMSYVTGGDVTADDLTIESPYNTYLNYGLPPTPICSPSIESIRAALEPADTNYKFFFINDKVHQFSETYEEHEEAIAESLYGSADESDE